ncbi:MAG: FAD binding domain-containing protein [Marivibrio sp.]|uniref:FAD binding domain-containing protein n=1 Tax=Marivibrio sp. TaxID=2039719 RepID=UPI0032EC05EF
MTGPVYHRPTTLQAALERLAERPLVVLSGGTDHYPARVGPHAEEAVLDIGGISELRFIREEAQAFVLGGRTTWTDVVEAELPPWFDALKQAAREIGGVQIQNRGTLAGNLCNASPAADGTPCLLAADAAVELHSVAGPRRLPLADFLIGYRATARRPDELLTAIHLPKPDRPAASRFLKLGARRYLVISIAMVAATLEVDDGGAVAAARIAVGACSATAQRLSELEAALVGRPAAPGLGALVSEAHLAELQPIDDVRASAAYRRRAARTLVARALEDVVRVPAEAEENAA